MSNRKEEEELLCRYLGGVEDRIRTMSPNELMDNIDGEGPYTQRAQLEEMVNRLVNVVKEGKDYICALNYARDLAAYTFMTIHKNWRY